LGYKALQKCIICHFSRNFCFLGVLEDIKGHGLGKVMTLSGPSAAATPTASLYVGIIQILFFWIYKIQSHSLCFGILRGIIIE